MDEIATEGDVLTKFKAAGGSATGVPDSTQCVTKANLTNPSGLPNNMVLNVAGTYDSNELVADPDITFREKAKVLHVHVDCENSYLDISRDANMRLDFSEGIQFHYLGTYSFGVLNADEDYYTQGSSFTIGYIIGSVTNKSPESYNVEVEMVYNGEHKRVSISRIEPKEYANFGNTALSYEWPLTYDSNTLTINFIGTLA